MEKLTRKQLAALTPAALAQRQRDLNSAISQLNVRDADAWTQYDALKAMQQAVVRESNRRMDAAA